MALALASRIFTARMQLPEWLRSQDNKSAIKPHRTAHSATSQPPVTTSALRHPRGPQIRMEPRETKKPRGTEPRNPLSTPFGDLMLTLMTANKMRAQVAGNCLEEL